MVAEEGILNFLSGQGLKNRNFVVGYREICTGFQGKEKLNHY